MKHSIATIICYCTNDYRFLRRCVEEARRFSQKILIPVCDHFFNGAGENRQLLEKTYEEFSDCEFIEFAYDPHQLYHPYVSREVSSRDWSKLWHSTARYIGALFVPKELTHVLLLDTDEIIDGKRFLKWLDCEEYLQWNAIRLLATVYVHRATLKVSSPCHCSLFAKLPQDDFLDLLTSNERLGWFASLPEPKRTDLLDEKGEPFVHHYSWVRTKEECLDKASSWGHRLDRDWVTPIEKMFENPNKDLKLMDFDHGFEEVVSFFDPLMVEIPTQKTKMSYFQNVRRVDRAAIGKKEIERLL